MFCRKCGKEINDDASFCTNCGARVNVNKMVVMDEGVVTDYARKEREKVFRTKQSAGIVYLVFMVVFIFIAIVSFFEYSELPKYFYAEERGIMFILGVGCLVMGVEYLLLAVVRTRVKLCIGSFSVSGIVPKGILVREIEYSYDEISEVKCKLGCLQFRANGKWVTFPGLENKEKAKEMIEERIEKY